MQSDRRKVSHTKRKRKAVLTNTTAGKTSILTRPSQTEVQSFCNDFIAKISRLSVPRGDPMRMTLCGWNGL